MFTQLKDSAFLTIGAIIAVLSLSFGWYLGYNVGYGYGYVMGRMYKDAPKDDDNNEISPNGTVNPFGSHIDKIRKLDNKSKLF